MSSKASVNLLRPGRLLPHSVPEAFLYCSSTAMRGTSRDVFTVQKDRRDLLAPDFPEHPQMQSLRRALWALTDHPQDETAEGM